MPAAEQSTVQLDEELKDTATTGEATTFPLWIPFTSRVDVPTLSVVGDHDALFCFTVCRPGGVEAKKEPLFWSPGACLEFKIAANAGHFVQLQRGSAAAFKAIALDWLARRVGLDSSHAPTQVCAA